ncbi:MAG TPA: penicillin-binding transpeptidase domain-containing protein [Thermoanaerobaculia bacterium]|nr:penicillin-binding transpeptidase domain-containing protein [Thermoanaerobaculia bacterium]
MPKISFLALIVLLIPHPAPARPAPLPQDAEPRIAKILAGTNTAFVLYDTRHDRTVRFDAKRCRERFTPFSTFKIPNSIIALETGVVADPDAAIRWDQKKRPAASHWPDGWKRDHSLRSAFKGSAVWFYQEVAVKVGPERMAEQLRRLRYGNQDISGGIDQFWLASSLKISADEQVEFLRALLEGRLGASRRTREILRELMVYEKSPAYTIRAKTGGGPVGPGKALGWLVGYVEANDNLYIFAINTDGPSYAAIKDKRIDLAKAAMRELGVLPAR